MCYSSEKNIAIVLAAGKGRRMGNSVPKQFLELEKKPILYYSLYTFQNSPFIDEIILVTEEQYQEYCYEKIVRKYGFTKVRKVVTGGMERYHSVYAGLKACESCDNVLIHDGARPFVTDTMVQECIETVRREGACVVGVPAKDTVKLVDSEGYVVTTPAREKVWNIQTPQGFSYNLVMDAYTKMLKEEVVGITDDAMVVENYGACKVKLVKGSYENIKITTPDDIKIAYNLL